jgi:hypothetical protein
VGFTHFVVAAFHCHTSPGWASSKSYAVPGVTIWPASAKYRVSSSLWVTTRSTAAPGRYRRTVRPFQRFSSAGSRIR